MTRFTNDIARAVGRLLGGGLVAFPTETVYGLGADAEEELAVRRVYAVKGRPLDHPLIVHLAAADQLDRWAARVPDAARELARRFWPGPLTLVVERHARVAPAVTGGLPTVGLRVPAHPVALALLSAFGRGIAAPSANRFGGTSPTTAEHVWRDLGDALDLILDGGPCCVGVESTIVDVTSDEPAVLRPGGVTREELEAALGRPVPVRTGGPIRVPGQLPSHYAPRAHVELAGPAELFARVEALAGEGRRVGVLALADVGGPAAPAARAALFATPEAMARGLYAALRDFDEAGCDAIVAVPPDERGLGLALADRLRRAAGPRPGHEAPEYESAGTGTAAAPRVGSPPDRPRPLGPPAPSRRDGEAA